MKATHNELDRESWKGLRRSLLVGWLPALLMAACIGCKQKPETPTRIDPAGTYTLVSIDGNQVPCELTHEGHPMAVQSGTFIINSDGTCSSEVKFSVEPSKEMSREVKATYTQEGSTLTMKWEGAGTTTGTVDGDTFTMNNEGMIFSYHR